MRAELLFVSFSLIILSRVTEGQWLRYDTRAGSRYGGWHVDVSIYQSIQIIIIKDIDHVLLCKY